MNKISQKQLALIAFLIFSSVTLPAHAANNFAPKAKSMALPLTEPMQGIPVGEKLAYDVIWMGVPVGIGELEVKEKTSIGGREAYHVVAVARTNDFLSKIYPVRDEMHSWIDAQTFQSLQFEKKASEGNYRADEVVTFDATAKVGHYESLKNGSKKDFPISVPVHDVISAFFWARRQPFQVGRSIKTTVNSNEKDWALEIEVLRRESKELRSQGVLDTILIEPKTRLEGVLDKRGRVWIHLKNDASRTPIWITLKTPFGPVVGVMRRDGQPLDPSTKPKRG